MGDRASTGLGGPLRLAAVRLRHATRSSSTAVRAGSPRSPHSVAADPGHEPDLHRQGRLLHRHQAGPARCRDGRAGRRAARGVRRRCWALGRYPQAALDKVWRQLAYGAHHDAITGSESDQVYIDLLTGWREAYDLAAGARDRALDVLLGADRPGDGRSVVVTNTLPFARDRPGAGTARAGSAGGLGRRRPTAPAGPRSRRSRTTARWSSWPATCPSMGWRTYRIVEGPRRRLAAAARDRPRSRTTRWRVVADPARGGGSSRSLDRAAAASCCRALGNELRLYEEYPAAPRHGRGAVAPAADRSRSPAPARPPRSVHAAESPSGSAWSSPGRWARSRYEQIVTLWTGSTGSSSPPACSTTPAPTGCSGCASRREVRGRAAGLATSAGAVVGRGFALPEVDTAEHPWTLDNPANTWFGAVRHRPGGPGRRRARGRSGVAEVVVPARTDAPAAPASWWWRWPGRA